MQKTLFQGFGLHINYNQPWMKGMNSFQTTHTSTVKSPTQAESPPRGLSAAPSPQNPSCSHLVCRAAASSLFRPATQDLRSLCSSWRAAAPDTPGSPPRDEVPGCSSTHPSSTASSSAERRGCYHGDAKQFTPSTKKSAWRWKTSGSFLLWLDVIWSSQM